MRIFMRTEARGPTTASVRAMHDVVDAHLQVWNPDAVHYPWMTGDVAVVERAGKVYSPKRRPTKHQRQRIAQFVGRDGTVERFAIRQTLPFRGYDAFCPPSQAQYGAVSAYYHECCETRFQAHTMLCARDYASGIAADFSFTEPRRDFIGLCTAAFILADPDLRSLAVAWNAGHHGLSPSLAGGAHKRGYTRVTKFASGLISDMRAAGSEIFG